MRACAYFGALLLTLCICFLGFEWVALDAEGYGQIQEAFDVARIRRIEPERMRRADEQLAAYLRGADALDPQGEFFSERELSHMKDVRRLFDLERAVRTTCGISGLILLAVGCVLARRAPEAAPQRQVLLAGGTLIGCMGALALWAALDFRGLFYAFHGVFFEGDTWLFDVRTDFLIQILPQEFFETMLARIGIAWSAALVLGQTALWALMRAMRPGKKPHGITQEG